MWNIRFWCFLLVVYVVSLETRAQDFILADTTQAHHLDPHTEIFIDQTGKLSFEQMLLPAQQKLFKRHDKPNISLGYIYKPIWLKIKLYNKRPQTSWILEMPVPFVDTVRFYQHSAGNWQKIEAGFYLPHTQRGISHTGFAFPLKFQQDTTTIYLQVSGTSPKLMPLYVWEKGHFFEKVRHEDIAYGILFGVFIIMFCYNLMIFFALRDTVYLWYIFTIVSTASFMITISGYGAKYLWSDYPVMNIYGARGAFGLLGISVAIFSIRFLEAKKYAIYVYYALWSVVFTSCLALILTLLKIVPSATNNNLSFGSIVYLVSGYVILFKGNKIARFYVLAWSIYIVGGLMATLRNSGTLPHNFWTTHMVEIGAAAETFLLALALSDKYRKIRQDAHNLLEQKVQERTAELQERNEELTTLNEEIRQQSEEIMAQRDALEHAYSRIENQNTDIFDSLEYAKRIQDALLPMRERMEAYFADFLLLYQPKDIVSGDFYWFTTVDSWKQPTVEHDGLSLSLTDLEIKRNKIAFLAVVDCTGHGVPGAFMTMIGGGLLEQIVRRDKIYSPAQILKELDARLLRTFQQKSSEEQVQDGMDISLLQIDLTHKKLVWASAKRPLWIVEKGRQEFTIYKGDKYPIGGNQFTHKIFTEQEINVQEGDVLYTFSDGYADQFGEKGKYTVRRFKELLLENRFKTLKTQEMLLHNHTQAWRGTESQTDDILVIGLKF